jgi:hypothetical protein
MIQGVGAIRVKFRPLIDSSRDQGYNSVAKWSGTLYRAFSRKVKTGFQERGGVKLILARLI